jgi:hypothetical protein
MQTVYSSAMALGGDWKTALVAQALSAAVAGAIVFRIWRGNSDVLAKGAVLAAAAPLATPYFYAYDLVMLILPIGWLIAEGRRHGVLPWERAMIGVLFLSPLIAEPLARGALGVNLGPLVQIALLFTLLRRHAIKRSGASAHLRAEMVG